MGMKIKNKEWVDFKMKFLDMLEILGEESEKFDIPEEMDNFEIYVDECEVHPSFLRKDEFLKVEYDLTLCNTNIRTLSFSIFRGVGRLEWTMKEQSGENNLN
jgi:hypothetical protein